MLFCAVHIIQDDASRDNGRRAETNELIDSWKGARFNGPVENSYTRCISIRIFCLFICTPRAAFSCFNRARSRDYFISFAAMGITGEPINAPARYVRRRGDEYVTTRFG